jgi:hypothetical protein
MQSSPGEQGFRLPTDVHPRGVVNFCIPIPDDPAYISAFLGVFYDLTLWISWQRDTAHTGVQAAQVMKTIFNDLFTGKLICPPNMGGSGGADTELMIRQSPDNPCLLQSSIDGINWCTFADLSKCLPPPPQPGGGAPQPTPGGQACYHATMNANSSFLVPTPVRAGDIIQIQNASGAVSNSHDVNWHGADGSQFFAGVFVGFPETDGSNPVPAAPTSSLIINLGGTWYALGTGSITVPGGVTNLQPVIQVNDNAIGALGGTFVFDVCVTNNAVPTWTHRVDLALDPFGFAPGRPDAGDVRGAWVPGTGWQGTDDVDGAKLLTIQKTVTPAFANLTGVDWEINTSSWTSHVNGEYALNGSLATLPTLGEGVVIASTGFTGTLNSMYFGLGAGGQPATQFTLQAIIFHGTGTNPFGP